MRRYFLGLFILVAIALAAVPLFVERSARFRTRLTTVRCDGARIVAFSEGEFVGDAFGARVPPTTEVTILFGPGSDVGVPIDRDPRRGIPDECWLAPGMVVEATSGAGWGRNLVGELSSVVFHRTLVRVRDAEDTVSLVSLHSWWLEGVGGRLLVLGLDPEPGSNLIEEWRDLRHHVTERDEERTFRHWLIGWPERRSEVRIAPVVFPPDPPR